MATSKEIIKLFIVIIMIGMMTSCLPSQKCLFVGNGFSLEHWEGPIPKHGILYRYKKGSNFSILEQKSEDDFKAEIWQPTHKQPPMLIVRFTEYGNHISTESDYKLVLDNKIQYRIYNLESGSFETGCLLNAGKVNRCDIPGTDGIDIPYAKGCGEPVKN